MVDHFAVVTHNVTAMRAEPDSDAEQVSQALFGEKGRVIEEQDRWVLMETHEPYRGWVLRAHVASDARTTGKPMRVQALFAPARTAPSDSAEMVTLLPLGVEVGACAEDGRYVAIDVPERGRLYVRAADLEGGDVPRPEPTGQNLVAAGMQLRGVPYLWGGRSPFGIDCSGFTQRCHALCGVVTPRDANQQADWSCMEPVERGGLAAGDLVFFAGGGDPHGRTISHVGMALDGHRFIHSRGGYGVTVNALSDAPFDSIYWGARRLRR